MSTKINPGKWDCHAAALLDEPMFILLARDPSAPDMLHEWADKRRKDLTQMVIANPDILAGIFREKDRLINSEPSDIDDETLELRRRYIEDMEKCTDADQCADEMIAWRIRNDGVWRDTSQRRLPLEPLDETLAEAVSKEAHRAICNICVAGTNQIKIVESRINDWSIPGFAIRRHYFRFSSDGQFANLKDELNPVLPDFHVAGHDVVLGDVLCRHKSDSDLRLELQILEL